MTTHVRNKVSIALMVLLLFVTQACTDIFLSGLPLMATEFHASLSETNRLISIYNYSQAIAVLFIGVVSDLRGRRSTILVCLGAHIIATAWIAMSRSLDVICLMRAVQALGSAAVYIVLRLIIKDTLAKKEQIHATGLLVIGLVLSPIMAPVIGARIIDVSTWRNCFWAIFVFEVPLFLWAFLTIRESNCKQAEFRQSFSWVKHFKSYAEVFTDRYFIGLALIVGSAFAGFYAFISISSFLYINQFAIKETDYSYVFIAVAVAYLAGNRIMSELNAKDISPRSIIGFGISTSLLGTAAILSSGFVHSVFAMLAATTIGTCLLRLATALINPPVQVVVTNHFSEKGSYALGLLTCIQYSFAAVGTVIVSGLPFKPSESFTISTCGFAMLSVVGYVLAFKDTLTRRVRG
jgi:DHA1 family bicyclomycin/chloramphenicol resistance-like MFS transporter